MKRFLLIVLVIFLSINAVFALDLEQVFGIYKIILHEKPGTFSLYINNGDYKYIPIINPLDSSSSTRFYLKIDSKVYSLSKKSGIPVTQKMLPNGLNLQYTIKDKAIVTIEMTFSNSTDGQFSETSDIICFNTTIQNLDTVSHDFNIKTIFDTCLGESTGCHFSTESFLKINDEMEFTSMFADKYIRTSDFRNTVQFLLDGNTITRPSSVVLANKDILNTDVWMPKVVPGRGYNSIHSYNNSAICVYWKPENLKLNEKQSIRFYISGARSELRPADINAMFFTKNLDIKNSEDIIISTSSPDVQKINNKETKSLNNTNPVVSTDNVSDIVVTNEMMEKAYIDALLQRIEDMEKNIESIDNEELIALNNELDAILKKVRH